MTDTSKTTTTLMANAIMKALAQQVWPMSYLPSPTATTATKLRKKTARSLAEKKLAKFADNPITEFDVKKAIKKRLDEIGAYHWWPVATGYGLPGLDCAGVYRGRSFWIEAKRPGKAPTTRQDITIAKIRACGGEVYVVDSEEAAGKLFSEAT